MEIAQRFPRAVGAFSASMAPAASTALVTDFDLRLIDQLPWVGVWWTGGGPLFTMSAMRPEDPMVIAQIPKLRVRAVFPV